jgi:hypothetical protein
MQICSKYIHLLYAVGNSGVAKSKWGYQLHCPVDLETPFSLFIFIKKEKYKNILLYIMTLSIKQYTKENQEIFATLSIQSKYKLLGSFLIHLSNAIPLYI